MLSAKKRRSREMYEVRNRIEMEEVNLARTAAVGKRGVQTWKLEAEKVREKIAEFEDKVQRLQMRLAVTEFDENVNDIRATVTGGIRTSVNGEDFGELTSSRI